MKYLANNIVVMRKALHLTQKQLAQRMHLAVTTISGYELGTRTPDIEGLVKLSHIFNVSIDDLIKVDLSSDYVVNVANQYNELLSTFKDLSNEQQDLLLKLMKGMK